MRRRIIDLIRELIRLRAYDLTVHATEEMAEDDLDIIDVEDALLNGRIVRRQKDDSRGTKFVVEGLGADGQRPVGVVGRFHGKDRYLIITVYEISND